MHRVPNVISISSDEEEDSAKTSPTPQNPDEVSLIAIDRKRKKPDDDDLEDGVVVIVVQDKEPLEEVTTHYENQNYLNDPLKPINTKPGKKLAPLIDLLSEEEDEEIVFRPVTLAPKAKRLKPTLLTTNTAIKPKTIDLNIVDEVIPMLKVIENDEKSVKTISKAAEGIILSQLLSPSKKPSIHFVDIMNNHVMMTAKDITKNITEDVLDIKETELVEKPKKTLLPISPIKDTLADTILMDDNAELLSDSRNDDNDSNSSESDVDNNHNSAVDTKTLDKSPEANLQRFKSFLRLCSSKISEEKAKKMFREKHTKFLKLYKVAGDFVNTNGFQRTVCDVIDVVKKSTNSYEVVKEVMKMYNKLKEHKKAPARSIAEEEKLDHLYELLKQFTDKIKTLETTEVDLDDEDDSAYVQLQTYRAKAAKVHERICIREKKNKYHERLMYTKLDFDRSSYQAINIALNRKYKNNSVFPTFEEMNRLIRKIVKNNGIEISEISLKEEIKTCFVLLGELLQRRRRFDLQDSFTDFVDSKSVDPASKDPALDRKLLEHKRAAYHKINEICEKYTKIQESGVEPELSSDPDDSNIEHSVSSDEETEIPPPQ